jgi:peptidoglycan/xylan/chitin deacetylase (PgdA/CDA1 family)
MFFIQLRPMIPAFTITQWSFLFMLLTSAANAQKTYKEIPILCYHHIKEDTSGKSPDYTIGLHAFAGHLKMLTDSGYTAILPGQLLACFRGESSLPSKSIMITFDDSHAEHFAVAAPLLDSFDFKGVFFVTAVTIGKPGYMRAAQLKILSDNGHVIGAHSWDHPDLRKVLGKAWDIQLNKALETLTQITGKTVEYFAYPFGAWNEAVIEELKKHEIKAAFQLSARQDKNEPLFTLRRLMVSGAWSENALYKRINSTFWNNSLSFRCLPRLAPAKLQYSWQY